MRKQAALIKTVALLLGLFFSFWFECRGQNPPSEYQIKAAFIYNFARFVDWPDQAFPSADSPMIIGVLGKNVFGNDLQQVIGAAKPVKGHSLQVKEFDSVAEATNCQVLFISASEKNRFAKIISQLNGTSVLTIGEADNFIADGGMINLVIVDSKVRFQINNDAAKKAGLTISSKLLSLAIADH
jgi:hypothetical protein